MRVGCGRGGLGGRCLDPRREGGRGNVGNKCRRWNNADVVARGKGDDVGYMMIESDDEENAEQSWYIRPRFVFDEEETTESVSPHLEASYFVGKRKISQVKVNVKWRIPDKRRKCSSCGFDGNLANLMNRNVDAGEALFEATNSETYKQCKSSRITLFEVNEMMKTTTLAVEGEVRKKEDQTTRRGRKGKKKEGSYSSFSLSYSKPPPYIHVIANRYNPRNRPKRHPPSFDCCQCNQSAKEGVRSCSDMCLNRLIYMECVGNSMLKTGKKNPYWNCNCGTSVAIAFLAIGNLRGAGKCYHKITLRLHR
jgi:hypothetical protein